MGQSLDFTTESTGNSNLILVETPGSNLQTGDVFTAYIDSANDDMFDEWEYSNCTYLTAGEFSRDAVMSSSANDGYVTFSSGVKTVIVSLPVEKQIRNSTNVNTTNNTLAVTTLKVSVVNASGNDGEDGQLLGSNGSAAVWVYPAQTEIIPASSTTVEGTVRLSTNTETITGTSTNTAITPIGLANTFANSTSGLANAIINASFLRANTTQHGVTRLASNAETLAGAATNVAITPLSFNDKSAAANGFIRFPGGIIIQWGWVLANSSAGGAVTFPVAFTTAVYSWTAVSNNATDGLLVVEAPTTTTMNVKTGGTTNRNCHWIAIGT